jgi:hypothetical protein
MVARIKDRGLESLGNLKARVLRQRALQRITHTDAQWLVEHVEEIERYIARMTEQPDKESEMF